jgi:hypothetical protein
MRDFAIMLIAIIGIVSIAMVITLGLNSIIGFPTDINNEHIQTQIAAISFIIGLILKFIYFR